MHNLSNVDSENIFMLIQSPAQFSFCNFCYEMAVPKGKQL